MAHQNRVNLLRVEHALAVEPLQLVDLLANGCDCVQAVCSDRFAIDRLMPDSWRGLGSAKFKKRLF